MKKQTSNELVFREEDHTYWIGKKRIPGVNEILKKVGLAKSYDGISPFYSERGKATHLAIKYYLENRLDPESLDEVVKPHFNALLTYSREHAMGNPLAIEKSAHSIDESFAGTPDLITNAAIYDWKCSKDHDRVAELQGQAYKCIAMAMGFPVLPFIVVELHDDGSYKEFNYGPGMVQWASVMDLYRWRIKRR